MNARVLESLRRVEIFTGLSDDELLQVSDLCSALRIPAGKAIFKEGDEGQEMFVILEGSVRVMINARRSDGNVATSTINTLYSGQCFGEMVLLGSSSRSATVATIDQSVLLMVRQEDFGALCASSPRIGYLVMRNLAHDLSYKLRSSNLLLHGNIRWQGGELDRT